MTVKLSQLRDCVYNVAKELYNQLNSLGIQKEAPQITSYHIEASFQSLLNKSILEQCECRLFHMREPEPKLASSGSSHNRREYVLAISALLVPVYNSLSRYHLSCILNLVDSLLTTIVNNTTFPIQALNGASLTMNDLLTVKNPKAWLNDEIINAQISLINAHCDRVSIASTHFYTKMLTSGPYGMTSWLHPFLSPSIKVLVIPINLNNTHWVACSIHIKGHFILCFDSMGTINTFTIKPILMLLVAHAGAFGLTKDLICKKFVILFPGYARTFLEIDTEHHILEELVDIEVRYTSRRTSPSYNVKGDVDTVPTASAPTTISISSTESDAEVNAEDTIVKSPTSIDSRSKQVFKQFIHQRPRFPYYMMYKTRPRMCGISNRTSDIGTSPQSVIDAKEQDIYTDIGETHTSDAPINIALEIISIISERTEVVDAAKQKLKDEGLDSFLNAPPGDILAVDVKRIDEVLDELHSQYQIESLLTSAAEAVSLSLNMPHQQNGYDCGVYMLLFIKMIARQFGPGYPLVAQDTKKARALIATEVCMQRLLINPQDLGDIY